MKTLLLLLLLQQAPMAKFSRGDTVYNFKLKITMVLDTIMPHGRSKQIYWHAFDTAGKEYKYVLQVALKPAAK